MSKRPKLTRVIVPASLRSVRDLVGAPKGSDEREVLKDFLESAHPKEAPRDLWIARCQPSEFQRRITLMVIARGTTKDQVAHKLLGRGPKFHAAFAEARRQLAIHGHALWVRVVETKAQTKPTHDEEALVDVTTNAFAGAWPVPKHEGEGYHPVVHLRARCCGAGCVHYAECTQKVPSPDLLRKPVRGGQPLEPSELFAPYSAAENVALAIYEEKR